MELSKTQLIEEWLSDLLKDLPVACRRRSVWIQVGPPGRLDTDVIVGINSTGGSREREHGSDYISLYRGQHADVAVDRVEDIPLDLGDPESVANAEKRIVAHVKRTIPRILKEHNAR